MANEILIAIPVYNEGLYVRGVLDEVCGWGCDVLVVDDGSFDRTLEILKLFGDVGVIRHKENLGYGKSIIDAFEYAGKAGYKWVITMDCDRQHEPALLGVFIDKTERDSYDIVSGSRYLDMEDKGTIEPPLERVAINRKVTALLNERLGLGISDAFCGFKAYRVEAMGRLILSEWGYGLSLQLWVQAAAAGLRVCEAAVPLIYHDASRSFGGVLENHDLRLKYYLEIIERELAESGFESNGKIARRW